MALLAVDTGGTKVAQAMITRSGEVLTKETYPVDPSSPTHTIERLLAFAAQHEVDAIGICVPAVLEENTDRLVWVPNLPGWNNFPLRQMLEDALRCPVVVEYDGHAAVLGEWWAGAGKGYRSVASVIIGTGIGGGLVLDGKLWRGRSRLSGAVGWFPMMGPDGLDAWENLASGPAISRRIKQLINAGRASSLTAETVSTPAVFDAARQGDTLAKEVVQTAAEYIGLGVANIISLINPEIVILGGSVGQQGDLLLDIVRTTALRQSQPVSARDVQIVSSSLSEDANLLGMAYAAFSRS